MEIKKGSNTGKHLLYVGLLAVIMVSLFSGFFFSKKMVFGSDLTGAFGMRVFYKNAIEKEHTFPFWLNDRLSGMPTADALAGDAMYPPSIVVKLIEPPHRASPMVMILHLLFGGIMFYIMMVRAFKAPPLAAFIGGAFFMLNPSLLTLLHAGHDSKLMVITWMPFLIWRLKTVLEKPSVFNSSMIVLGVTMCLLTGHVQMVYFVLAGMFAYWLMWTIYTAVKAKSIKPILPQIPAFWVPMFVSLAAAAIQFWPVWTFMQKQISVRGVDRGFEFASSWSLHWPEFWSLLVPEFVNSLQYYWGENPFKLNSEYIGVLAVLFAVLAIVTKPKPWRIFWAVIGSGALLFGLGAETPFFKIAYEIVPGVKKFRAPSMIIMWVSFSATLLTVLFLKDLALGRFEEFSDKIKARWTKGLGITTIVLFIVTICASQESMILSMFEISSPDKMKAFSENFSKNFVPHLWLAFAILTSMLWLMWAVMNKKVSRNVFLWTVLCVGLFDLIRVDRQFIKIESPREYFAVPDAIREVQAEMKTDPFRVFYLPGTFNFENSAGIHKMEQIMGFHDNELAWYRAFRGDAQGTNFLKNIVTFDPATGQGSLNPDALPLGNEFLSIANCRYIFARVGDGTVIRIENKTALKRISFVPSCIVMPEDKIAEALKNGLYNPAETVALIEKPAVNHPPLNVPQTAGMGIRWDKYEVNERIAKVAVPADGFLRISEVYYSDWEILVDGKPVQKYRADLAWIAVNITKGQHTITMRPRSLAIEQAAKVSFPIMGILLAYWFIMLLLFIKRSVSKPKAA